MGPELPAAALARDRGRRASCSRAPFLIYQESSLVIRAIRDYFQPDIGEILIDTEEIYEQAQQFMSHVMPDNVRKREALQGRRAAVLALPDRAPDRDRVFARRCRCPPAARSSSTTPRRWSPIDVNSARATKGGDIEETAFNTNLRSRRRSRAPAAPARPGRPDRHRLHRHGEREATSAKSRTACATRCKLRPRARADRQDLALRPDGAVAPAPAPVARRIGPHPLPALPRHRPHPRHRIDRAAHPAHHPGRGDEGQHRRRSSRRCRSTSRRSC